jgi:hypothetical protein
VISPSSYPILFVASGTIETVILEGHIEFGELLWRVFLMFRLSRG